jgi:hypothetical protein
MELLSSDAYLKGNMVGENNTALKNLKKTLREELSSINLIDEGDDNFDKYCQ